MNRNLDQRLQQAKDLLKSAENELEELERQLDAFERVVDAQLGSLLDQLSDLNAETDQLADQLKRIREERLFGKDIAKYQDGAPIPAQQPDMKDAPIFGLAKREDLRARPDETNTKQAIIPDIKVLYRKLARRYHPDLARDIADRASSNEQMTAINQAYRAGDLKALLRLAGVSIPYGVAMPEMVAEGSHPAGEPIREEDRLEHKLKAVRQQINRLSSLPIVRLSLEVKLAQHQGRNLLRELAAELQYKVGRKLAERDYLQAQIKANSGG